MSAPAPALPPFGTIIDVRYIYGPLLLGAMFNMILFGILVAQVLTYFQSTQKDPLYMRVLVYGVFFVECANTALDIQIMFQLLVLQYAAIPDKLPTVFMTIPVCVILVAFPCQLFFIWRIRTFTKSNILSATIVAMAVTTLAVGIWAVYHLISAGAWARVPLAHPAAETWLFASAGTDLVIAFCLAWALKGKKTGMASTDTVVDRIIRMTIQTGVVTAFFNVMDVVSFLTIKNATFNFMFNIPLSKLYSNCLMSTLNARTDFNKKLNGLSTGPAGASGATSMTLSAPMFSPNPRLGQDTFDYGGKMMQDVESAGGNLEMTAYAHN
ncbi:hypothetical protein B0H11DRAFT_2192837 [Mycena galericulata]|nr:hypothetical protein B0H11DRAFT_2052403 [Mycena galericulata]KAJ7484847.1 hypothetical protein B0H11DRAFT_2192837 [Mycena galericulata]